VGDTPSEITRLLDKHYCDRGDFGRWLADGAHEKLVQAAAAINHRTAAINRVLKRLSLSHTQLFTRDSVDYHHLVDTYAPLGIRKQLAPFFPTGGITYPGIEILTQEHNDRHFVAAVATKGAGDKSGLILGDELVAIDGVPFAPVERFRGREGAIGGPILSTPPRRPGLYDKGCYQNDPTQRLYVTGLPKRRTGCDKQAIGWLLQALEPRWR
jgi:hypothetical protein